jgi:hypothetical protein
MASKTQSQAQPNKGERDLPLETRAAPITSVNAEARTLEVTWTTGAAGDRIDWMTGQRYVEELVVSDKAIRLARLNAGAPVLDSHDRYSGISAMLAVVERAWIEKGEGRATIRFPKEGASEKADAAFRMATDLGADGKPFLRSLSVGYRRLKIEVDKSKDPQIWRVVDWEPFEISFVSVPFDTGAQVRDGKAETFACEFRALPGAAVKPAGALARMRMRMRSAGLARD